MYDEAGKDGDAGGGVRDARGEAVGVLRRRRCLSRGMGQRRRGLRGNHFDFQRQNMNLPAMSHVLFIVSSSLHAR